MDAPSYQPVARSGALPDTHNEGSRVVAQGGTRREAREPAVRLTATPPVAHLGPGDRAEVLLGVEDMGRGDMPTCYLLDIAGVPRSWYTLADTDIMLDPGASAAVPLLLHPAPGKASPGRYPIRARVTWPANPLITASAIVTVTIAASGVVEPAAAAAPAAPFPVPVTHTRAARPPRRRRVPAVAWLGLVLVVLLGEGAVLVARRTAPRPPSDRASTPPTTRLARAVPIAGPHHRAPYGTVAGVTGRVPAIQRFARVRGGTDRPPILTWQVRGATRVTLDGTPVPARGTRAVALSARATLHTLRARAGQRVATARVRVGAASPLTLAATVPVALVNLTALRFPGQPVGAPGAAQTLRVVNLGPGVLIIAGTSLGGDHGDFDLHDVCAHRVLRVDDACAIAVRFTPTRHGARHAVLAITDNTAASPHAIPLDGQGVLHP